MIEEYDDRKYAARKFRKLGAHTKASDVDRDGDHDDADAEVEYAPRGRPRHESCRGPSAESEPGEPHQRGETRAGCEEPAIPMKLISNGAQ